MQKAKLLVTLIVTLALVLTTVSITNAAGPSGGWASGISCQNLDTSAAAVVTLSFYPQGSSSVAVNYTGTIPAGSSFNWLTTSAINMPGFPSNFIGSGVISSTSSLACNVNTQSTGVGTTSSPYRIGTNAGFNSSQVAPKMYIPQALRAVNGYNSYVAVQNTTETATSVTMTYINSNGTPVSGVADKASIPGYSTHVFYQNETTNLPNGFNGGAVVSADNGTTPLAVTIALYRDATSSTRQQFLSFNGVKGGSSTVRVPRYVRNLSSNGLYNSGLAIQNVGGGATSVTVTFSFPGIAPIVITNPSLAVNATWLVTANSVNFPQLAIVDTLQNVDRQGSAVITTGAGGSVVATVNETNDTTGFGSTYNAVNSGDASKTVFFPQFTKGVGSGFKFYSGFQISDASSAPNSCRISYAGQPSVNETVPLPANGTFSRAARSGVQASMLAMANGYNAAVKVECDGNVTGIVNLASYGSGTSQPVGDSFTQTTGLNQ